MKNILFTITSHSVLGSTGHPTGYWLSELAHSYEHVKEYNITFASPKGGKVPLDPGSVAACKDDVSVAFLNNAEIQARLDNTVELSKINPADYAAVIFPGGHGPLYDLAVDASNLNIVKTIYENGGIVAAVCHGPAGLANVKLSNGDFLVKGKRVTGFSNAEETLVGLEKVVPFLLEDKLVKNGGNYEKAPAVWAPFVVVDGKLITGQNPDSSHEFGLRIAELLK